MRGNRRSSAPVRAPLFEENLAGSYWLVVVERIKAEWSQPKSKARTDALFSFGSLGEWISAGGSVSANNLGRLLRGSMTVFNTLTCLPEKALDRLDEQTGLIHETLCVRSWESIGAGRCHHAGLFPVGRVHAQRQLLLVVACSYFTPLLSTVVSLPLPQSVASPSYGSDACCWYPVRSSLGVPYQTGLFPVGNRQISANSFNPSRNSRIANNASSAARNAHHHPVRPTGQQVRGNVRP